MKKIINGRRYDTDTAKAVGEYCFSNLTDFHHVEETLYRKKTGEFFLYGVGGPMSKYAERTSLNSWSGGAKIVPLTYEEAKQWGEDNLDGDEYEKVFGEVDESLEGMTVCYSLPAAVVALIKREAEKTGRTQGSLLADLILKEYGPRKEEEDA